MDRGARRAQRVAKSWTRLSDKHPGKQLLLPAPTCAKSNNQLAKKTAFPTQAHSLSPTLPP